MLEARINHCGQNRKHWIDIIKAICMLGVFLQHTQSYCASPDYAYWVKLFYVNAFFFVSGYLFYYNKTSVINLHKLTI